MTIKTVSLQTAKALRNTGFPQQSSFAYCLHATTGGGEYVHRVWDGQGLTSCGTQSEKVYAPTTDELLNEITNNQILQFHDDATPGLPVGDLLDLFRDPEKLAECWLWLKREGVLK